MYLSEFLPQNISGKTALITGGTTGIGRATAISLAAVGVNILIFGRHKEELEESLQAIRGVNPNGAYYGIVADVAKQEDIERIFDTVDQKFDKLDILVNNAAIGHDGIESGDYKDWDYLMSTNLTGYLACCHESIKRMKPNQSGHIINIGSLIAETTVSGRSVYAASKAGIQGFTEALRNEINPMNIKVSLIEPGLVSSDMIDLPADQHKQKIEALEMLKAEDIAMSVLYCLCQPKRSDIISLQIRPHLQLT